MAVHFWQEFAGARRLVEQFAQQHFEGQAPLVAESDERTLLLALTVSRKLANQREPRRREAHQPQPAVAFIPQALDMAALNHAIDDACQGGLLDRRATRKAAHRDQAAIGQRRQHMPFQMRQATSSRDVREAGTEVMRGPRQQ